MLYIDWQGETFNTYNTWTWEYFQSKSEIHIRYTACPQLVKCTWIRFQPSRSTARYHVIWCRPTISMHECQLPYSQPVSNVHVAVFGRACVTIVIREMEQNASVWRSGEHPNQLPSIVVVPCPVEVMLSNANTSALVENILSWYKTVTFNVSFNVWFRLSFLNNIFSGISSQDKIVQVHQGYCKQSVILFAISPLTYLDV